MRVGMSFLQDKLPELPVGKTPGVKTSYKLTRLKKVLDEIRRQDRGVEANLAQVLTPRTSCEKKTAAKLQKEGKKLLAEVGTCGTAV